MRNNKSNIWGWIIVIIVISSIFGSIQECSDSDSERMTRSEKKEHKEALEAYFGLLNIMGAQGEIINEGGVVGLVHCDEAKFSFSKKDPSITVKYSALGSYAEERGELSKMSIVQSCGITQSDNYYPISIQGRWKPVGSGGGVLVISFSRSNEVEVNIFGDGNFQYWSKWKLKSLDKTFGLLGFSPDAPNNANDGETIEGLYEAISKEHRYYFLLEKDHKHFDFWSVPTRNSTVVGDGISFSFYNTYCNIDAKNKVYITKNGINYGVIGKYGKITIKGSGKIILKNDDGKRIVFRLIKDSLSLDEKLYRSITPDYKWIVGRWQTNNYTGDPIYTFSSNGKVYSSNGEGYYSFEGNELRLWWGKGEIEAYRYKPDEYFSNYSVTNYGSYYAYGGATFYKIDSIDPEQLEKELDSALPESYVWLVTGGDWMDNPFGYDSPVYSFKKDKSYESYEYSETAGDIRKKGRYAILDRTKLVLLDEGGKMIIMDLDLENERVKYQDNWFFAQNGTKFDEMMRESFNPGTSEGLWDYYHSEWDKNGVFVKFNYINDSTLTSATFTQYPINENSEEFDSIMRRTPVQILTLSIQDGKYFVDASGKRVAKGSNDWPNYNIIISGEGGEWYLGTYGCQ